MRLLFGQDRDVAHWVAQHIPHMAIRIPDFGYGETFGMGAAIGVIDSEGVLAGGVVYHNYDPYCRSMELSCASTTPRWLTREIVGGLLRYPFLQANCQRLTSVTPRRATSTRRLLEGLGFRREGSIRRGFGDDNAIVYGLLAEDWAAHRLSQPRRGSLTDEQEKRPISAAAA